MRQYLLWAFRLTLLTITGLTLGIVSATKMQLQPRQLVTCTCTTANHTEQTILLKILILQPKIDLSLAKEIAQVIHELPCADPNLILALISVESDFDPEAVSRKGAVGLIQCLPQWFDILHLPGPHTDIYTNLRCGTAVLNLERDRFQDLRLALIAYNRGPNPVHTAIAEGKEPDNGYAEAILKLKARLESYD